MAETVLGCTTMTQPLLLLLLLLLAHQAEKKRRQDEAAARARAASQEAQRRLEQLQVRRQMTRWADHRYGSNAAQNA